jgi:hypothetical protein
MILDQDQKFFGFKISVNPPLSASGGFWFWVKDDGTRQKILDTHFKIDTILDIR